MRRLSYAGLDLISFASGFFALTSRLKPSQWVEKNIYLPSGATEIRPGRVSFDKRPFWREPLDCIVDPSVQDVIVIAPTRMGKTFLLRMIFSYVVAVMRQPMLWYDSTVNKALSVSKKELQPLIERNKVLRDRKPTNPDHFTNLMMLFPAAYFEMFGANSDAQSSGETCAIVLGNELAKWRQETDKEASIIEQTRHRTEDRDGMRKHIYGTTPSIEGAIEDVEYKEGDQRKYFVPCPVCGYMQHLEWGTAKSKHGVKWDLAAKNKNGYWDMALVAESARYCCISCEDRWDQKQLQEAVLSEKSEWRATVDPVVPNKRSYHINGLYDHLGAHSLASLAQKFLSSRDTGFQTDRRDFWNACMGMPWISDIRSITVKSFSALELSYLRGELPDNFKPDVWIFSFDVQTWGLPWVACACSYSGECYVVDWGVGVAWSDIDQVQSDYAGSARSWVIGDIRFAERRPETLQAIYDRRRKNWVAFQGEEISKETIKLEKTNAYMGGKLEKDNRMVAKFVVSTYIFKCELESRYSGEIKKTFFPQLPLVPSPDDIEEQKQFYSQLTAEKRVERKRKRKGLPEDEFRGGKNNHWGDCMVEAHALLYWLQHRLSKKAKLPKKEIKMSTG